MIVALSDHKKEKPGKTRFDYFNGAVLKGIWSHDSLNDKQNIKFLFVFKQMGKPLTSYLYLNRILVFSNDELVATIRDKNSFGGTDTETSLCNIVMVNNGIYKNVGLIKTNNQDSLNFLNDLQLVLDNFKIPIRCSVQLLPKTSSSLNYAYGLFGGILKSSLDGKYKSDFISDFYDGTLFEYDFSSRIFEFINKNNGELYIIDQKVIEKHKREFTNEELIDRENEIKKIELGLEQTDTNNPEVMNEILKRYNKT